MQGNMRKTHVPHQPSWNSGTYRARQAVYVTREHQASTLRGNGNGLNGCCCCHLHRANHTIQKREDWETSATWSYQHEPGQTKHMGTHITTEDDRQTGAQGNGQDLEKRFVSNHWIDSFTTQKVWQIADINTKSQFPVKMNQMKSPSDWMRRQVCTRGYMQYFVCHHEQKVVAPPEGTSSIVWPNLTFPFTSDLSWSCLAWRQLPVLGTDSGPLLCSWPDLCYTKTPLQELAAGCLAKDSQAPASVCKKTQERPTLSPFPKHFGAVNSARKIKWQATGHRFLMVLHHKQLQDRRQMQACWCVYFRQPQS